MLPEDYLKAETEYKTYIGWLEWLKYNRDEDTTSKNKEYPDTLWPNDDSEFFKIYPESIA